MSQHRDSRGDALATESSIDTQTDASTIADTPNEVSTGPIDLQDLWDVLCAGRRRQTVRYLATHEDVMISELANHIAACENDCSIDQLDSQQRKGPYVGLYQQHLNKLDAVDIVDWDKARGTVERSAHFPRAHATIEAFTDTATGALPDGPDTESTGIIDRLTAALGGVA